VNDSRSWFGAKCLFIHHGLFQDDGSEISTYEERVILVQAVSMNWAITTAEKDAREYAGEGGDCEYLNFIDCFQIFDAKPEGGAEVYSLMRKSELPPEEYIDRFYESGDECTTVWGNPDDGLDGDVTAFGPFSRDIVHHLEQDASYYRKTTPGSRVIVNSVLWSNGKRETETLAACLGIGLFDFDHHELDPDRVNVFMLNKEFGEEATRRFIKLRDSGFTFFFTPWITNPDLFEDG
tara:strand:+ start:1224 stop:1931 length:708 start_codon:yes stop_codon:yes gene_type:complete